MISYLIGKPKIIGNELVILTGSEITGAVGYGVKTTTQVLSSCTNLDDNKSKDNKSQLLELYIYTHVKEDKLDLYGFTSQNDVTLFKLLLTVSGVGPNTALAIMNKGAMQVIHAVQTADVGFFSSIKRVGKKAAQKIIIELKNKLGGVNELNLEPMSETESEIVAGLEALGFKEAEIEKTIKDLDLKDLPLEKAIQLAIKNMGKKK